MDNQAAEVVTGRTGVVESQVDVLLTWSDFLHSLETLRHKPYSGKSHERDWFRLNPLDIVLLGSKTVKNHQQASEKEALSPKAKISHTSIAIQDISSQILTKPRIFQHIILCLGKVLKYPDVGSAVIQKCCFALVDLYEASLQCPSVRSACIHTYFEDILPIFTKLGKCHHVTGNPSTRIKVEWLTNSLQEFKIKAVAVQGIGLTLPRDPKENPIFIRILESLLDQFNEIHVSVALQIVLLKESYQKFDLAATNFNFVAILESYSEILVQLNKGDVDYKNGIRFLLQIFQILFCELARNHVAAYVNDTEIVGGTHEQVVEYSSFGKELMTAFSALLDKIRSQLTKWNSLYSFKSCVPSKLVELVFIGLSSQNLHHSLESMLEFWGDPLSLLMIYASEGYLTKDSSSLFIELLDFISCAIEVNLELQQVVTNFIPNLFGPVFGIHDGRVLCKVLEFGKLALKSRHRKKLLWDGLRRILKVYKLFEPIQIQRSKEDMFVRRVEAVIIALDILDEVIERCSALRSTPSVTDRKEYNIEVKDGNETTTQLLRQLPSTTEEEVLNDQRLRVEILLYLLELANAMISSDQDILYMFASILPRVFTPVPLEQRVRDQNMSHFLVNDGGQSMKCLIPWEVDLRSFAVVLLALAADAQRNGACRPFQLCAVVLPKLVKNLAVVEIVDEKKLQLIEDIFKLTHETLQAGHDIDVLVSHGISLMSQVLPTTSSADELRSFMEQLAKQLRKPSFSSVVLFVSNACDFMLANFPEDTPKIQQLFLHLLRKGKRDDVRNICRLCNKALCETRLDFVRSSLYSHASGGLTSRQLVELSEILVSIISLSNEGRLSMPIQNNALVTGEALVRKRIIFGLTNTIIERLREMLGGSELNKTAWLELRDAITKVSVCLPLLTSEELMCEDKENVFNLDAFLRRKFPPDVLKNTRLMSELGAISKRIQLMQKPRFEALKELVVKSLKEFLSTDHQVPLSIENGVSNAEVSAERCPDERVPVVETTTDETLRVKIFDRNVSDEDVQVKKTGTIKQDPADGDVLYKELPEETCSGSITPVQVLESQAEKNWGQEKLQQYLLALPRNEELRERLVKFGYSEKLWCEKLAVKVSTDGTRCIEENLRENLVACFSTYQGILKELGIPRVEVDGTMVDVDELFDTTISSVAELKGRRAIAVKLIDKHIVKTDDVQLLDRKNVLLSTEDSIEAKFEEEARKPRKPVTFIATVNTNFFDCAKCCGSQIVGCYSPSGVHCERPLEIGIRQDSAFASIYDETDTEIENCELLFTDQGVYLFRAYTNSHPYDTSQVWIELLTSLLGGSSPYVPAIIIPYMHPSVTTWNSLRRHVPVEMTGSILTCDLDFSVKWQTYYDYRPESIRGGKDIVLKPGFDFSQTVKTSAFLQRQLSVENKDLGGLIFEQVMKKMCEDDFLKTFRFLGAHISLYINSLLENGYGSSSFLSERFDYERWLVHSKQIKSTNALSKEEIVHRLTELVQETMSTFCKCVDFEDMFTSKRHQLFEMKTFFLQAEKYSSNQDAAKSILEINQVLRSRCNVTTINALEESLQEEIMHWIFRNEDRVWRFRGGRDGYETLEQFMSFLGKGSQARGNFFPGIIVYIRGDAKRPYSAGRPFKVRHIVAYAVGEYGRNKKEEDDDDDMEEEPCEELIGTEEQAYEVVTAWVHPRFRRLNLAVKMYMEICRHIRTPFLVCDILENSLDNIIHSSFLFRFLDRVGFLSWFVAYRLKSYTVITQSGEEEQFERIVIRRNILGSVMKLTDAWVSIRKIVSQPSFAIGFSSILAGIFIYRHIKPNC